MGKQAILILIVIIQCNLKAQKPINDSIKQISCDVLPKAKIFGSNSGKFNPSVFRVQQGVVVTQDNLDIRYEVLSFKLMLLRNTREPKYFETSGPYFSDEMKEQIIRMVVSGDVIVLYNVVCKTPQGYEIRPLPVTYLME